MMVRDSGARNIDIWKFFVVDVQVVCQGYASLAQTDTGLHMRQYSRAFIVAESATPNNRIVFINSGEHCFSDSRQIELWIHLDFSRHRDG